MKFTIDIHKYGKFGFIDGHYRLQPNGSLRVMDNWNLINDNDLTFDSLESTISKLKEYPSMVIDNVAYSINPSYGDSIKSTSVHLSPRVHRVDKPHIFTPEELIKAIYEGDDSHHNSLVIDLHGHIKLQKFEDARKLFAPVAVRYETFCAGNDYVGPNAANNLMIDNGGPYLSLLGGFLTHLRTGELDEYVDFDPQESELNIMDEIYDITKHLN